MIGLGSDKKNIAKGTMDPSSTELQFQNFNPNAASLSSNNLQRQNLNQAVAPHHHNQQQ